MKNKFSILFITVIIAIGALLAIPASAAVGTVDFGITNLLAGPLTNSGAVAIGSAVNVDNKDNIGLQFVGAASTTTATNITVVFARSGDGVNYETTPVITWVIPLSGAVTNVAYTNLPVGTIGAAGYIKVTSIRNPDSCNYTNASLVVIKKRFDN